MFLTLSHRTWPNRQIQLSPRSCLVPVRSKRINPSTVLTDKLPTHHQPAPFDPCFFAELASYLDAVRSSFPNPSQQSSFCLTLSSVSYRLQVPDSQKGPRYPSSQEYRYPVIGIYIASVLGGEKILNLIPYTALLLDPTARIPRCTYTKTEFLEHISVPFAQSLSSDPEPVAIRFLQ